MIQAPMKTHLKEGMEAGMPETLGFNLIAAGKEGEKEEAMGKKAKPTHTHGAERQRNNL